MPTEAQINANRLNALKSGIDAWSHIIPGEDPAELEALTADFLLHFHPSDPNQLSLVHTLISSEWIQRCLRRIRRIDATHRMSLHTLQALLDLRAAPATPVPDPPSPVPTQPLTPQIGFVPQSLPAPVDLPEMNHEHQQTHQQACKNTLRAWAQKECR